MLFRLDDKVAIVTGAGSGIGESIAKLFAAQGASLHLLDVDERGGRRVEAQIREQGGHAAFRRCDVSKSSEVEASFSEVKASAGKLDVLVNNAGISHVGSVETTSDEDFERVYSVNVKGAYHCLRAGVRDMKASGGGAILNLASTASLVGLKDRFAYSMSKGAMLTMTLSVAADYISDNIRCNCVCPARIHTPFVDGYLKKHYPGNESEMFDKLSKAQPIGRMGRPDEVAMLALFLCSEEAAFITGSAYPIDGGVTSLV